MKLTNDELYLINEISGGGILFGIHLHKPRECDGKGTAEGVLQSLKKKGLLESEEQLSRQGAKYVHAIRRYREANRHFVCNRIYAAQVSKEEAVVIMALEEGYDIYRMPFSAYICLLMDRCIRLADGACAESGNEKKAEPDEVLADMKESQGVMTLGHFLNFRPVEEFLYYVLENRLYRYDISCGRKQQISSAEFGREVAGMARKRRIRGYGSSDLGRG